MLDHHMMLNVFSAGNVSNSMAVNESSIIAPKMSKEYIFNIFGATLIWQFTNHWNVKIAMVCISVFKACCLTGMFIKHLFHSINLFASQLLSLIYRCLWCWVNQSLINVMFTLRPTQNGRYFPDDIFRGIFCIKMYKTRITFHWSLFLRVPDV